MFTAKSFVGQISALGIALKNQKAESPPIRREVKIVNEQGLHARPAVLVLVAPALRRVEVVTAAEARARIPDEAAQRAVDAMTDRFAAGDLTGGLVAGIAELAAAAGPGEASGEELPDLLQG